MSSVIIELIANTWTQITTEEKSGGIRYNKGLSHIIYTVSDSLPTTTNVDSPISNMTTLGEEVQFTGIGESEFIFAYSVDSDSEITVTPAIMGTDLLKALTTAEGETGRLKVDSQPTSFESNTEFKITHRFNNVSGNNQILYWVKTINPANLMTSLVRLKEGKREYLVVPDPQDGTYDAVKAVMSSTQVPIRQVNTNLEDSGLSTHPVSEVTALFGVGNDLIPIADDAQFPNFNIIGVGTQGNSALASSVATESNLTGVAANSAFFLVLDPYDNDTTSGQFYIQWEERF